MNEQNHNIKPEQVNLAKYNNNTQIYLYLNYFCESFDLHELSERNHWLEWMRLSNATYVRENHLGWTSSLELTCLYCATNGTDNILGWTDSLEWNWLSNATYVIENHLGWTDSLELNWFFNATCVRENRLWWISSLEWIRLSNATYSMWERTLYDEPIY